MAETFAEVQKSIARFAEEGFAKHVLTVEGPNEWRVGEPGTGIMAFRVLCRPGMVAVWGDLGEWILRCGAKDSAAWLPGAVRSPDYLLEKVKAGERLRFYPADARALLDDPETAESWGAEVVEKVQEELGSTWGDEATRDEWYMAWSNAGADEAPDVDYPCEAALWLIESLRAFVKLEGASPEPAAPVPVEPVVIDGFGAPILVGGTYLISDDRSRDNVVWWNPKSAGYTVSLDRAGRYSGEEAAHICRRTRSGGTPQGFYDIPMAWPVERITGDLVCRVVNVETLLKTPAQVTRG